MTRDVPEDREEQALRIIAVSFFALAGYVAVQAVFDLASRSRPETSTVGIALAAVSLVVMPLLAGLKRRNGRRLGSGSVVADSNQTLLCTYLSVVLLVGLLLNVTVGWWWADPVAALVIAALAINEGREAARALRRRAVGRGSRPHRRLLWPHHRRRSVLGAEDDRCVRLHGQRRTPRAVVVSMGAVR